MRQQTHAQLVLLCLWWGCTSLEPPTEGAQCKQSDDCRAPQSCDVVARRCVDSDELGSSRMDAGPQDSRGSARTDAAVSGERADAGAMHASYASPTTPDQGSRPDDKPQMDKPGKSDTGSCKAEVERCDNIDNDCDLRVDETLSEACGSDQGECRLGQRTCEKGHWSECRDEVSAQPEQCDGLDNDCNGQADEAAACELHWKRVSVSPGPSAREQSAHAYDPDRKLFVIHGGFSQNMGTADTWAFDVSQNSWSQLSDTGPSPRRDHAMAYDTARKRFVLFGGFTGDSGLHDTWELDGQTWQERQTEHTPPDHSLHALVYDATRHRVVMFGGFSSGAVSAQTWEYDGTDWQERTISGPSARRSPALTYDTEHKRVLMFGGSPVWGEGDNVTTGFNDLWAYDGTTWQQLTAADPPRARWFTSLVWHPKRKLAFLYGGVQMATNLSDTYEFNGTSWIARTSAFGMPEFSYSAAIIYDPVGDRLLSFGGTTAENNHTDAVWELR